MSALAKSPSKVMGPKSPAGPTAATAPRPASPKKALAPGKTAASPPAGSSSPTAAVAKKAPSAPGLKAPPAAPGALKAAPSGAVSPKAAPSKVPAKAAPSAASPTAAAGSPAAPSTSAGKKLFKKAVAPAGAATLPPAAASSSTPPPATPDADAGLVNSSSAHFSESEMARGLSSDPIEALLVVAPPNPGTAVQHAPLDQVIAKNQEAAAALAILVSKQTEQDREKLAIANSKVEAMQKLLMEREAENKSKIDALEKQLSFLVTAHASTKRENELLKDVLSDRDGPKMVQRLEQLEDENKKLKNEAAKYKEMSDYYRNSQLRAMEDMEKLREGQPIGPTQTEWELAQENISKMAKDNATLTLRLGDLEERLSSLAASKDALLEQQQQQQQQQRQQQHQADLSQEHQRALSEETLRQEQQAITPGQPYAARAASQGTSGGLLTPQRGGSGMYNNLSIPPGFLLHHKGQNTATNNYNGGIYGNSTSAASPSPYVNNSKFSGFSGSPIRGTVDQSASNTGGVTAGGTRGWRALMLPNGNVIYHNVISNRSQWEVPNELAQGMTEVAPTTRHRSMR